MMPQAPSRSTEAGLLPAAALLVLLPALPGLASSGSSASALRAEAEAIVGAPVAIDPRLRVPDCPGGFRFTPAAEGRTLRMACPATGWQAVAPLAGPAMAGAAMAGPAMAGPAMAGAAVAGLEAAAPGRPLAASAAPAVRRGDLVTVGYDGPGFRVTVEAIAEASAAPGERVMLRNRVTGQRFPATVADDGTHALLRR